MNDPIYKIIKNKNFSKNKNNYAHLHCFDLNKFEEIYGKYIILLKKYFNIIVTYCEGINNEYDNEYVYLKIQNIGMDIGAKFCFLNFLKKKYIKYNFLLFLHSKSDKKKREYLFQNILNKLDTTINNLNENIGIFTVNLLHTIDKTDGELEWGKNMYHMRRIIELMNLPNFNLFPEGNIYILNKIIADYIYDNRFNLYRKLNYKNSFDYSWFINYYRKHYLNYVQAYNMYKALKLHGNNINLGLGHKGLADCMIEHSFERIIFGVCKLFRKKIIISGYNEINNKKINSNIFLKETITKPILLIACDTNSNTKLKYLVHNLKCFIDSNLIDTIYVLNSKENKGKIEAYFKNDSIIINNQLNKKQVNKYSKIYYLFNDKKFDTNEDIQKYYNIFGEKDELLNSFYKKEEKLCNINFKYYKKDLNIYNKWYKCLQEIGIKNKNFYLTNDSFVIANNINSFLKYCNYNSNIDLVGLTDCYYRLYHYTNYLKYYSYNGIKKWIELYKSIIKNPKLDVIVHMDLKSTLIISKRRAFYNTNRMYNDDFYFNKYKFNYFFNKLKYPIIKMEYLENGVINPNSINYINEIEYKNNKQKGDIIKRNEGTILKLELCSKVNNFSHFNKKIFVNNYKMISTEKNQIIIFPHNISIIDNKFFKLINQTENEKKRFLIENIFRFFLNIFYILNKSSSLNISHRFISNGI